MKLYHGSTSEILEIDLQKSKPNKDFGKGFYLSDDERQAHRMALYKSMQLGLPPVVNVEQLKYMKGITFQYFFGTQHALKLLTKI